MNARSTRLTVDLYFVFTEKGYPKFQKDNRSVEYKASGWKLAEDRKSITFTDKNGVGRLKTKGTRDLNFDRPDQIKRVRMNLVLGNCLLLNSFTNLYNMRYILVRKLYINEAYKSLKKVTE
jgi:hypothetical protein